MGLRYLEGLQFSVYSSRIGSLFNVTKKNPEVCLLKGSVDVSIGNWHTQAGYK